MLYQILATATAIVHFAFILFVVLGGLVVLRWPKMAFLHLPAAVWGVMIEFAGWYCPLTRWENHFLREAGKAGYNDGFVAHYLFALIYPNGLTRGIEIAIGAFVLILNLTVYARLLK
ncbi:MAG TPA: DUF2784 domain-containing protein [Thermoanaerobaculia bacterium]|jgi:hypothetical protein